MNSVGRQLDTNHHSAIPPLPSNPNPFPAHRYKHRAAEAAADLRIQREVSSQLFMVQQQNQMLAKKIVEIKDGIDAATRAQQNARLEELRQGVAAATTYVNLLPHPP